MTRLKCCGWCGVALVAGYITQAYNGLVYRQYICRRVAGDDETAVLWWCGVGLVAGYITPAQNGLVCRQYICRRVAGDDQTAVLWMVRCCAGGWVYNTSTEWGPDSVDPCRYPPQHVTTTLTHSFYTYTGEIRNQKQKSETAIDNRNLSQW